MSRRSNVVTFIQTLQDSTYISNASLNAFEEDIKIAAKERLIASQRRGELLKTLRRSFQPNRDNSDSRQYLREDITRKIETGGSDDVLSAKHELVREMKSLQTKNELTRPALRQAKELIDELAILVEKLTLFEKVAHKVKQTEPQDSSEPEPISIHSRDYYSATHNNRPVAIRSWMGSFESQLSTMRKEWIDRYTAWEELIHSSRKQYEYYKSLLFMGFAFIPETSRKSILNDYRTGISKASLEHRMQWMQTHLQSMIEQSPLFGEKIHRMARQTARELMKHSRHQEAIQELYRALRLLKMNSDTYRLLSTLFYRIREPEKAFSALRIALHADPNNLTLRKRVAQQWLRQGNRTQALSEYRRLAAIQPGNPAFQLKLGELLFQTNQYRLAIKTLIPWHEDESTALQANLWIGLSLCHLKLWEHSIFYLYKVLDRQPNHSEAIEYLVLAMRNCHRHAEAIDILQKAIEENPESFRLNLLLAAALEECRDWKNAAQAYRTAIHRQPDAYAVQMKLAGVLIEWGEFEQAQTLLDRLREDSADPERLALLQCSVYQKNQRYDRAIEALETIWDGTHQQEEVCGRLVELYTRTGQWNKANQLLKIIGKAKMSSLSFDSANI